MHVKIYELEKEELLLQFSEYGEHIIGRSSILRCTDNRISRNHAMIKISENAVTISSIHVNPLYYLPVQGNLSVLSTNIPQRLYDGDKIGLLPDQFWYLIKMEDIKTEMDGTDKNGDISTQLFEDPTSKRSIDDNRSRENKRIKVEDTAEITIESSSTVSDEKIEEMQNSNNNNVPPDIVIPEEDVKEPKEEPVARPGCSQETLRRDKCWYGDKCYRKNRTHREEFSHPNDADYNSDSNDERSACPYGQRCYRTNLEHRKNFKHPGPPAKPTNLSENRDTDDDFEYFEDGDEEEFEEPFSDGSDEMYLVEFDSDTFSEGSLTIDENFDDFDE